MNRIQLAYDITPLGLYFSWPDSKTGIYRVAEELLDQLAARKDVKLTLTGLCGEVTAFSSIGSQLYFESRKQKSPILFDSVLHQTSFNSLMGLGWLYETVYSRYFSKAFQKRSKKNLESLFIRGMVKILNETGFANFDTSKRFDSKNIEVFHSIYSELPDRKLTGNLPRLITIYDLIPLMAENFVNDKLNNYFYKILESIDQKSDWVACISEYTRQEFCDFTGFPAERTYVTYLAADEMFRPVVVQDKIRKVQLLYNIPDSEYFLCLASHLDPRKNIFHLIKTFVRFIRENPRSEANLVLIGTLRFKRSDVVKAIGEFTEYKGRIIFTGYVPDEDLSAIYSGAIAFVFPSLYEGFGLPVLEAMQSGTPVISSNATSLPEVAGDAAILVDPKDEDALCQAMREVLHDVALQQELKRKGLKQAKKFSWAKCADQTVEIYKQIIS